MRIAIFSDNFYPEISGISDSILTTAGVLASRGHFIRFYAPRYGASDYDKVGRQYTELSPHPNIDFVRFSAIHAPTPTGQGRVVIPYGLRTLGVMRFRPDVIHVHLPLGTGLEGVFAAWALGVPLVGTDHTPVEQFLRYVPLGRTLLRRMVLGYNAWFYNRCDFVSSPSQTALDEARRLGLTAPGHQIANPIRTDFFRPLPNRASLKKKWRLGRFTIAYAGRIAPEKRIDEIVRALGFLRDTPADLLLVGAGPDTARLKSLAAQLGIADRLRFTGFLDEKDLLYGLNAADVFVIMSQAETQSIAMMNAFACGIPAVGARAWGLAEYLTPASGFLVEPGDTHGLARRLRELYRKPALAKKLGAGARRRAEEFSPERIADLWESVYREMQKKYTEHP